MPKSIKKLKSKKEDKIPVIISPEINSLLSNNLALNSQVDKIREFMNKIDK